jgi:ABC-type polysaccharide/polyol phosphate export permease
MLIGLPIVVIGIWVVLDNPLGPQFAMIPVLLLVQALYTVGLGYILATLNAMWRDTYHLVGVSVQVWMFATPIFYPPELVRVSTTTFRGHEIGFSWMLDVNPMYWLIESWRTVLLWGQWPDPSLMLRFSAVAVAVFFLGCTFFMQHKRTFPDLL